LDLIFLEISLSLYLVGSTIFLALLFVESGKLTHIAYWLVLGGFVSHCLSILHRTAVLGILPLVSAHDVLSFFACMIIGLFLILRKRVSGPIFGCMATTLASVLILVGTRLSIEPTAESLGLVTRSWWLPVHVILALAGNAVFALMAMGGTMYVFLQRLIKTKRIGPFYRHLPSLETLDTINRHGLPIGFFLLTLGIISGALWAERVWGTYWSWDPKETWSLITWFAYAAMVHQRLVLGWRGKRAALMAILGFCLVMFTFLGVSLLMGGHHSFQLPVVGGLGK
jgi:cytochrome c-type biogenesis protein CcsB